MRGHGLATDIAYLTSWTVCGHGQTAVVVADWIRAWTVEFVDIALTPCGLKRGYRVDVARTPFDSCLASTRMIHLILRG